MATVIQQHDKTQGAAVPIPRHDDPKPDTEFQAALAWLLPDPVCKHGGRIETLQQPLHEAEMPFTRRAVERRVLEFTAGRACARVALAGLGIHDVPVGMGVRREPLWPDGAVGSISHAAGYCIAAVAPREHIEGLGVDIESVDALPDALIDLVCSPPEKVWCECQESLATGVLAKFMFSAKEAVFKCLYPVFGEELDFEDVALELDLDGGRFIARVPRIAINAAADLELGGRLACTSRHVLTAAFLHDTETRWLNHGYLPRQLDGCEGQFICN